MLSTLAQRGSRVAHRVLPRARLVGAASLRKVSTLQAPQMMCFQCEQTSSGKGCTTQGICSKTPELAGLQDLQMLYNLRLCQLASAAPAGSDLEKRTRRLVLESTFATLTNVNFDDSRFESYLKEAESVAFDLEQCLKSKRAAFPAALHGLPDRLPSDHRGLLLASGPAGILARGKVVGDEDLFGVLEMATYGLKGVAAYFFHAEELGGYSAAEADQVYDEFFRIGAYLAEASTSPASPGALAQALGECLALGALNLKVMQLLDTAHTTAFGHPAPTSVSSKPGGRPAILVSGHDLGVLHELLVQSDGKGVDVYTHGEMLPGHSYPKLHGFEHLRGHFGTHWGNQLHEFRHFPGPVLMTSNCLRPPTRKYRERLWTAGPVGFEGIPSANGDFTSLINQALECQPFDASTVKEETKPDLLVGFGHQAVLGVADKVVSAIKAGDLKHVFVIGGCDGTESTRSYFTDLARATPKDSMILTLGCGKFRLNGEDHGTVAGLPRLLDVGQCNDAYGAVVVATKLAEALGCTVHDLPLHFAVSWFEQKAVAVLLTLLHLELKNIRIGPAVPAFLTPNVLQVLNEKFGLQAIDAHHEDDDLAKMLQGH